jgi:hypothetical protein
MSKTYSVTISDQWDEKLNEVAPTGQEKKDFLINALKQAYIGIKAKVLAEQSQSELVSLKEQAEADLKLAEAEKQEALRVFVENLQGLD